MRRMPSPNLSSNRSNLAAQPPERRSILSGSTTTRSSRRLSPRWRKIGPMPSVQPSLPGKRAAALAVKYRGPAVSVGRWFAENGGLMSYSAKFVDLFHKAAGYVDKILKGARPADLPVEQSTLFELVINMKTARALGIAVPPTLLARVDEVIE